jgi:hypothetical protein
MDPVVASARLRVGGGESEYAGEQDKCGGKFLFHHHSTVEGLYRGRVAHAAGWGLNQARKRRCGGVNDTKFVMFS